MVAVGTSESVWKEFGSAVDFQQTWGLLIAERKKNVAFGSQPTDLAVALLPPDTDGVGCLVELWDC